MAERSEARLVGRDAQMEALHAALALAAGGRPTAVVVAGELGVGKTRLVREFLAQADVEVFAGASVPVVGEPLPYAALTQALRSSGSGVVRQEIQRSPDLARLLPGQPDEATPAGSRLRLFQSVLGLLGRLSAHRPVAYVVEDVQWADGSTLDLLAFLAANLTHERVLIVLTHRTESAADDRVVTWLAEFGRLWPVERVPLPRLDRTDTGALVEAMRGSVPGEALLDVLMARSAGNPLFVEQLALTAHHGDAPLPETLHHLLRGRVEELPDESRRVLGAASVIGRRASLPLLARMQGVPQHELEDALRPALAARVVELRDDVRLDFHHPAFLEVVYGELLPGERVRLHLAAAEALAADRERFPAVVGEMARHWHQAGELDRALQASLLAGATYSQMYAFGDAYAAYTRVLDLVERVPHVLDLSEVRLLAAEAAHHVGDPDRARELLELVRGDTDDPHTRALAAERIGALHLMYGDGEAGERAFAEALALVPEGETSVLAARIQGGLALLGVGWSRLDDAELAGTEGLRIARAVGARREEGIALNALGTTAALRGDLGRAVDMLREALEIAREVEDPWDLGAAYVNLSHVLGMAGRLDECVELGRVGIVELTRFGQQRVQGSLLLNNVSEILVEAGRFEEAGTLVAEALSRHPRGIRAAPLLRLAAHIAMVNGDLTTAWERCEQARLALESETAPVSWMRIVVETAAEIDLWAGRPEAAYDAVADGLDLVAGTDDEALAGTLVALGMRALADAATVHRDRRSRTRLASQRARLEAALDLMQAHPAAGSQPEDPAVLGWVEAERARYDGDRVGDLWAASADAWADLRRPFRAAYARWREAETRLAVGVSAESLGALRSAHAAAQALGARRLVEEVETLARWYRADLLPAEVEELSEDPLAAYGLTEREREVLAALAAGHTNREIADELFISVKTASVHVSNILRKLDVDGRQEAARIAHRLGVHS
ncbi:MAG TPA: AAA family ATPase [Nocardioides sp.]|nr:AAA family ATPase [Nocardioides sp.]